jgi:hypothetical protein
MHMPKRENLIAAVLREHSKPNSHSSVSMIKYFHEINNQIKDYELQTSANEFISRES